MFGYFITRKLELAIVTLSSSKCLDISSQKKLGLATATSSSAKCLDISSQENWDLPLPHQVQQNVWIFHHKKTGTCSCHIIGHYRLKWVIRGRYVKPYFFLFDSLLHNINQNQAVNYSSIKSNQRFEVIFNFFLGFFSFIFVDRTWFYTMNTKDNMNIKKMMWCDC